jgi:hypothetical protein
MTNQNFVSRISIKNDKVFITLPFDPNEVWGKKARHYITGSVNGHPVRGLLESEGSTYFLLLGAAWRHDTSLDLDAPVTVVISPEGPQQDNLAKDIAAALASDHDARAFFESLATFYRKNYIRWIESAKRPETRTARISEMLSLLKAKEKQK